MNSSTDLCLNPLGLGDILNKKSKISSSELTAESKRLSESKEPDRGIADSREFSGASPEATSIERFSAACSALILLDNVYSHCISRGIHKSSVFCVQPSGEI